MSLSTQRKHLPHRRHQRTALRTPVRWTIPLERIGPPKKANRAELSSLAAVAEYVRDIARTTTVGNIYIECESEDDKRDVNQFLLREFESEGAGKMVFQEPYFGVVVELGGPLEVRVTSLLLNNIRQVKRNQSEKRIPYRKS